MNRVSFKSSVFTFAMGCALALTSAGCGGKDGGRERSGKAVAGLQATRQEMAESRKQVDTTLAALSALETAQGDLKPAFETYKKEVANLEKRAATATSRAADMRARAAEYQDKWREELAKVSNPDLRAAAQERAAKVHEHFAGIREKGQDVRNAYEPFIRDLKDVQTYLSNDLTAAAVAAAKPVFDKAKASGRELQAKGDALDAELNKVAAEMSPGTPAKK